MGSARKRSSAFELSRELEARHQREVEIRGQQIRTFEFDHTDRRFGISSTPELIARITEHDATKLDVVWIVIDDQDPRARLHPRFFFAP